MASKEVDRQLLLAYLEGKYSRDQLLRIREYLQDEAYRDSLDKFMEEEWERLDQGQFPPLPGMDDRYSKFKTVYIAPQNRKPVHIIRRIMAAAAVLLLCAAGLWLLFPRLSDRPLHEVTPKWLSWHNEPGQHREIILPDSSRVHLGPAGTLQYRQNDDSSRLVQLEGEAYFVVRHDPHRPFTVITGALSTRDIGTAFNIRYYPRESTIAIAVASGKVQVLHTPPSAPSAAASSAAASSATPSSATPSPAATSSVAASSAALPEPSPLAALSAGQLLQYNSLTRQSGITNVSDPSAIGAWRNGVLSFNRQRLEEVTDELQRYYGVTFRYSDPAAKDILITTLLDNKSLEEALDILSLTAGIHFTHAGNEILIK